MNDWTKKPIMQKFWNSNVDYFVFLDENNCEDVTNITNKIFNNIPVTNDEKFFTLTGCIISKLEYAKLRKEFLSLKNKFWTDGKYVNKYGNRAYVCFHSNDIRRRQLPFSPSLIDGNAFGNELFKTIKNIDFRIISITINIYDYLLQNYKFSLYHTSFDFLLERLIYTMPSDKKIALMLEARGKKEDKTLHSHICSVIKLNGIKNITASELSYKIIGVYFNPKWQGSIATPFAGLELADLCSYPIHKFVKTGNKDNLFLAIESKIDSYPNYMGKGIKLFPKKNRGHLSNLYRLPKQAP